MKGTKIKQHRALLPYIFDYFLASQHKGAYSAHVRVDGYKNKHKVVFGYVDIKFDLHDIYKEFSREIKTDEDFIKVLESFMQKAFDSIQPELQEHYKRHPMDKDCLGEPIEVNGFMVRRVLDSETP